MSGISAKTQLTASRYKMIRNQHIDSAISGRYTVPAPYKAGAGIGILELHTATIGALASFCCYNSAIPKLWWAGWGHRKVRQFPYAPVTPTLLSSPPAKLAFPVVEVIHCIRRSCPSWLRSQLPHSSKLRSSTVRLLFTLHVACHFKRMHQNIVDKIEYLNCSREFFSRNFIPGTYHVYGDSLRGYYIA